MRHVFLFWPIILLLSVSSAWAEARMSVLVDVMRLREAAQILSQEGMSHAQALDAELLDGAGGSAWLTQAARIYDAQRLAETLRSSMAAQLQGEALEAVISFYASDLGTKIVNLENSARLVMHDSAVEEAARDRYLALRTSNHPRLDLIARYIATGDMVSRNLSTQLNTQVQLFRGLKEGGAITMTEEEILDQATQGLASQQESILDWLNTYFLLAYDPLSDRELEVYIAFTETEAGRIFNRALFAGFEIAYR